MAALTFDLPVPDAQVRKPWLGRAVGAVIAIAFMAGVVWFIVHSMQNKSAPKKPGVQQIAILKQPPPPPPKPPEKLPDPPKLKEEVKIDQPKPEPMPRPTRRRFFLLPSAGLIVLICITAPIPGRRPC